MSSYQIASLSERHIALATASHAGVNLARLKKGDKVLVHPVTDSTDLSVIRVVEHLGAEGFATFEDQVMVEILSNRYKLPRDRSFPLQDAGLSSYLKVQTAGHGIDLVFATSVALDLQPAQSYVARFARIISLDSHNARSARH